MEAEAKRVADEQALLAAEAEARRVAAEAAEQARMEAETQAQRDADEHARDGRSSSARSGQDAQAPGSWYTAVGCSCRSHFRYSRIRSLSGRYHSSRYRNINGSRRHGCQLYHSRRHRHVAVLPSLGNGELTERMLDLPARVLMPDLPDALNDVAATGGTVDMPYRIYGDQSKYSVVATQAEGGFSPKVPVRALILDPVANAYTFTTSTPCPSP